MSDVAERCGMPTGIPGGCPLPGDHQGGCPPIARCRSCRAPVIWALTEAHRRRMPVDAEPTPDGNVLLTDDDPPIAQVLVPGQASLFTADNGAPTFTSHFATCPNADQHRRTDR